LTRLLSLAIGVAFLLTLPATAGAATLDAGEACYFNSDLARLSGTGFAPDSPITFTVNDRPLNATATSDSAGNFVVRYDPPRTDTERRLVVSATDSEDTSAGATIFVSRRRVVTANPDRSSNVRTWRAVLRLFGFDRGRAFIHYVNPKGRHKKTVRLGRLRGPCGRLKTEKRRVMPFRDPAFGLWHLQFDTTRRYDRDTTNKKVVPVRVFRG
jgi:hypothetical protein